MHVQDEVIEEWDGSEPISHLRGNKFLAILAWFLLCAALMWPFNQLHMGFIGLVVAMVVAILILLWVRWLVSVIQRKLSGVHLTRRQWAEMAMGVQPGEIVEQDADDPAFNPGANVQHAPWARALAHATALQPYYQQRVATLAAEEDLPDTVIEENGMYFSDHFMPALAPMLGQIILVCGNRDSGKSNLVGVAAEEIGCYEEPGCPPVPILFIDMEDQWSPLANRKYFPRGFVVGDPSLQFVQKIPLRHFAPVTLDNAKSVGRKLLQHCLQFVFTMRSYPTLDDAVLVLCELIRGMVQWEEERENKDRLPVVIFFDEANKILPQEERYSEIVERRVQELVYKTFFGLVNRGRNYGFSVWFVTQRIQQIHKSLLQAAYKFLFFQGQKVDLEQYQIFGLEPEDVLSLQPGECYVFTPQVIGFRCYMRARVSPHLGHTPGLDQLRAYQQQVRPIETLNGGHLSGQVPDPMERYAEAYGLREQIAYQPRGRSHDRESVLPGQVSTAQETGSRSAEGTHRETSPATTGPEPEIHQQPPQRSGFAKLEINGIRVTAMQKLAYELHMQGHQTGVALATAMTIDGRFGKIDNNISYRLRNELAAKGLISIPTKRSQGDA